MSGFRNIYGHEKTIAHLRSAIVLDQVSHAYLISGDEGMGKKTLARAFAQTPADGSAGDGQTGRACGAG